MEYNFKVRRRPQVLLDQVCLLAEDKMVVSGDDRNGRFTGLFDGSYQVDGKRVCLHIRRKPRFVSWRMVEKGIDYLCA